LIVLSLVDWLRQFSALHECLDSFVGKHTLNEPCSKVQVALRPMCIKLVAVLAVYRVAKPKSKKTQ